MRPKEDAKWATGHTPLLIWGETKKCFGPT